MQNATPQAIDYRTGLLDLNVNLVTITINPAVK